MIHSVPKNRNRKSLRFQIANSESHCSPQVSQEDRRRKQKEGEEPGKREENKKGKLQPIKSKQRNGEKERKKWRKGKNWKETERNRTNASYARKREKLKKRKEKREEKLKKEAKERKRPQNGRKEDGKKPRK